MPNKMSSHTMPSSGHRVVNVTPVGIVEKRLRARRESAVRRLYDRLKFGRDPNATEFRNFIKYFSRVPPEIADSFAKILRFKRKKDGTVLEMEFVQDFDGQRSRTVRETGQISDPHFWERFQQVIDFFVENDIPFFNLSPGNVLVKRTTPKRSIPVFVDYKRMGLRSFPNQLVLLFKWGRRKKIQRKAQRLVQKYRK